MTRRFQQLDSDNFTNTFPTAEEQQTGFTQAAVSFRCEHNYSLLLRNTFPMRQELTCDRSSSPDCTSSPKPSKKAQWCLHEVEEPSVGSTLKRSKTLMSRRTNISQRGLPPWTSSSRKSTLVEAISRLSKAERERRERRERSTFLNVVVGKGSAIFELLASENQTLLIRRNSCDQS